MTALDASGDRSGRRIAGRYRLSRLINAGGSGSVWTAVDEVLGREVAIKDVTASPYLDGPHRVPVPEHTMREARAAGRVNHPGVVHVHDVVEQDGRPWIVMQLVNAPSLAELIARDGPLSPHRTAVIGLQLVQALRAAHECGVIHRDVKPSNVLVDGDRAMLTDFGIAVIDGEPAFAPSGVLVGAPSFIAPECVRGAPATPAADLWALGATLYAAVEGRPPFRRACPVATLTATATGAPDPMRRAGMLAPLLTELLRRRPAQRPHAGQVEQRLRRLLELSALPHEQPAAPSGPIDETTTASNVIALEVRRGMSARRRLAILAATAAAITVISGVAMQPHRPVGLTAPPAAAAGIPADTGVSAAHQQRQVIDAIGVPLTRPADAQDASATPILALPARSAKAGNAQAHGLATPPGHEAALAPLLDVPPGAGRRSTNAPNESPKAR